MVSYNPPYPQAGTSVHPQAQTQTDSILCRHHSGEPEFLLSFSVLDMRWKSDKSVQGGVSWDCVFSYPPPRLCSGTQGEARGLSCHGVAAVLMRVAWSCQKAPVIASYFAFPFWHQLRELLLFSTLIAVSVQVNMFFQIKLFLMEICANIRRLKINTVPSARVLVRLPALPLCQYLCEGYLAY